jgi:perosamine synthetase
MSKSKFISPYYSTIGIKECVILIKGSVIALFSNKKEIRNQLHQIIENRYKGSLAFSYSSARSALASFLSSINLQENDEVIITAFTCLAVPTAVIAARGKPVYCDIEPKSLNTTTTSIQNAITPNTKVIIIQHTLGSVAEVEEIVDMAKFKGIITIEDCALSIASKKRGKEVGTSADAAIFSMELSKTITVGWGGILLLNNKNFKDKVTNEYYYTQSISIFKSIRMVIQAVLTGFCYQRNIFDNGKYLVAFLFKVGFFKGSTPELENSGNVLPDFVSVLSTPQVFLASHQWKRLDQVAKVCEDNVYAITQAITELGYLALGNSGIDYSIVTPRVSFLVANRDAAMAFFLSYGIEAGSWFDGPLQPLPKEKVFNYQKNNFPFSVFIADHIVNIPCHFRINMSDLNHIVITLKKYAFKYKSVDMVIQQQLRSKMTNSK